MPEPFCNQVHADVYVNEYLLISGTNSDVSGRFSATASINTEKARSTVIPVNNAKCFL